MFKRFIIILVLLLLPISQVSADEYEIDPHGDFMEESPEFSYPSDFGAKTFASSGNKNYVQSYNNLEPATFAYMHDIDPDQYYDIKDTTWAPYPLLRLNSYIYFKSQAIEPGYYLITPREHKGKWYMLFKQNGRVVYIIPVYERELVPETFYDTHLPKPKLTPSQKVHMGFLSFLGKFDSTKRREQVKSYMEINDLENYFVSIIIYYGPYKYSTIFRTIRL